MSLRSRIAIALLLVPSLAAAISREEVMVNARSFAWHPWRMSSANVRGTCGAGYSSVLTPGDYRGLPYDWGGYMSVAQFDQAIREGKGAGSYPSDGIIACAVGLDCSGFVSQSWRASHTTTRGMEGICGILANRDQLLPGDVMNESGYHVAMYSHRLANGSPLWIESIDYGVHVNATGGWSWTSGWKPLRYQNITGTSANPGNPVGSTQNPIVIPSLPYTDTRDTRQSSVKFFDRCGAAATTNEGGPEYIYQLQVTRPGTLTITVQDDTSTDIDVHLSTALNTTDCVARNDRQITATVDCGTYYVVADTWVNASGVPLAGQYTLNVSLAASGASCGSSGPRAWNFAGEPGDACESPSTPTQPPCNPNLGSETCLYTSGSGATSWCTHGCATNGDCPEFAGGCCADIGGGERYCMVSGFCRTTSTPDAGTPSVGSHDAGFIGDADLDAGDPVLPAPPDAGTHGVDAGTTWFDAGTTDPVDDFDAGGDEPIVRDAGVIRSTRDAGTDADAQPSGCGCSGVDLGWGALAGVLLRRRRSSPRA